MFLCVCLVPVQAIFIFEPFAPFRCATHRRLACTQFFCDFNGANPKISMRTKHKFVAILEELPVSPIFLIEPVPISGEKAVHEYGNGGRAGSQQ